MANIPAFQAIYNMRILQYADFGALCIVSEKKIQKVWDRVLYLLWNLPTLTVWHVHCKNYPRVVSVIFTYSYSDYLDQRTFWTSLNVTQLCYIQRGSESSLVKKIRIWIWISVANNPGVVGETVERFNLWSLVKKNNFF